MKKAFLICIGLCIILLTGCGHSSKLSPKLLHLKETPVSVFDLALVRARHELNWNLFDSYGRFPVAVVVLYKEEKNVIDVIVFPWTFTTSKDDANKKNDVYFLVENEKEAKEKLEEVFEICRIIIGKEDPYFLLLREIGDQYFKKNKEEICKELGKITKVTVKAFYKEGENEYRLEVTGTLDGEGEYRKTDNKPKVRIRRGTLK